MLTFKKKKKVDVEKLAQMKPLRMFCVPFLKWYLQTFSQMCEVCIYHRIHQENHLCCLAWENSSQASLYQISLLETEAYNCFYQKVSVEGYSLKI